MDTKHGQPQLGPWLDADLARTAREQAGIGATADLPPSVRFIEGVTRLLRTRLAKNPQTSDSNLPAVFLLHPTPIHRKNFIESRRVPMLDNGLTPLTGRLWFLSAAAISGHYIPIEECLNAYDDDALFSFITDILATGSVPAVLFDPRAGISTIRFYPNGIAHPEYYRLLPLNGSHTSIKDILEAITHIYESCLITPDAQPTAAKLWTKSDKWFPAENAEALIQVSLKAGLVGAFPWCVVRHEQASTPGRVDLELEENDPAQPGSTIRHAVIELKVLRSFRSTGTPVPQSETEDWVESGVLQAAAYRDDKRSRAAALCCFDMRKEDLGDSCFSHVSSLAGNRDVILQRWYIFASSKLYRASLS